MAMRPWALWTAAPCPDCPMLHPGRAGSQWDHHTHSAMVKASSKFFCRCVGLRVL